MPEIWILVLLCQCVQPVQIFYSTQEKCTEAGRRELYKLDVNVPIIRCTKVER